MQNKILLYTVVGLTIVTSLYFYFCGLKNKEEQNEFLPPPSFSVLSELTPTKDSTHSLSNGESHYVNETLGFSLKIPKEMFLHNKKAELHQYELGSGAEKVGQEYKYYEFVFSNKDTFSVTSDHLPSIVVKVKEVAYSNINEWIEKDNTFNGSLPEETIVFERRNMSGEDALYGFDDWLRNQSVTEETWSSEYAFIIKNGLLYYISIYNLPEDERLSVWNSIKFD